MNYVTALLDVTAPDADAAAQADLLTVARVEGVPPAEAIADRRALLAVRTFDTAAEKPLADALADARQAMRSASDGFTKAGDVFESARSRHAEAEQQFSAFAGRKADAERATKRPAVAEAVAKLPKETVK